MKKLLDNTIAGVTSWKLVWTKAGLTSFVSGATVFTASMQGIEWSGLSPTQKWVIMVGIVIAMCNNMIAFLDHTLSDKRETDVEPSDKIKLP